MDFALGTAPGRHFKLKGFEAPDLEVQDAMVIEHVAKARAAREDKEKQDTIDRESAKYHFETTDTPGDQVQKLRLHFGSLLAHFGPLGQPTHAVCCALLSDRAYWMPIGDCKKIEIRCDHIFRCQSLPPRPPPRGRRLVDSRSTRLPRCRQGCTCGDRWAAARR